MVPGRYDRFHAMKWWDGTAVKQARALVAGCGALGNEVIKNLLLLGWGHVLLVDFDTVELSNVSRSILFREGDVGRNKSTVLEERAREINSDCEVVGLTGDLRRLVSAGMISRVDVVFGCVDNVAARLSLNQMTGQAGRLFIDGGLSAWDGTVSLYCSGTGACYACGLTMEDFAELNLRRSCPAYAARASLANGTPTTPTVSSIIAAQMVQFSLKWIHGWRSPPDFPVSSQVRFDTAYDRYWKTKLACNPDCPAHPEISSVVIDESICSTATWSTILHCCRTHLNDSAAVLQLPVPILKSWSCRECSITSMVHRAWLIDQPIQSSCCGKPAVPELTSQISGKEDWLHMTPSEMLIPPWTWLSACTAERESIFELQSSETTPFRAV